MRGQTAIATAVVAGLEFAWLCTLLYTASEGLRVAVSAPLLFVIYAASFAVALGLHATRLSSRIAAVISWLAWPLVTLFLLMVLLYPDAGPTGGSWRAVVLQAFNGIAHEPEAAVFIVPAAAILWWFGSRLATSRITYETVLTEFQFGLMVLAGSLFAGYMAGIDQPAAIPTAIVFVGLGLMGAAATRTDDTNGSLFLQRGGTWWRMLLISVGLVLALGVLAGVLFTPELMQLVARGFHAVWNLIERLLGAIAGLFSSSGSETQPPPTTEITLSQDEGGGFSFELPEWLSRPSRIVYVIFIGGLALAAIWRVTSQVFAWMRQKTGRGRAQIESLPGAFRLDIAELFRRILAWVSSLLPFGRIRRKPQGEPAQTTSVRHLYADMLRWGAKLGFPRGSSQTPFEYQQTLCVALPVHREDVIFITESYVRAKYGAQPPTETELHQLRESRRRLKGETARTADKKHRLAGHLTDRAEEHGDMHR